MTANTVAEIFASRREQHRRTVPLCYGQQLYERSKAMLLYGYEDNINNACDSEASLLKLSESSIVCTLKDYKELYGFIKKIHKTIKNCSATEELVFEFQTYCHDTNMPNIVIVVRPDNI